jgi:hypothetical protein
LLLKETKKSGIPLFLNGDIIDGWQLQRGSKWTKEE